MVAGHQVGAEGRAQLAQRAGLGRQLLDTAIHHVAGDRDHVRRQFVDGVDDGLHIASLDGRADVDIADLGNGESVQVGRQAADGHIHRHHARPPAGVVEAQQRGGQRQRRHRQRAGAPQRGPGQVRADGQAGQPCHQQCGVAQHRQHEQRRKQAHGDQAHPGDAVAPGRMHRGTAQHPQRNQHARQDQQQDGGGGAGAVETGIGDEAGAHIDVGQRAQGQEAQEKRGLA
ncbi:Uncharacterised protein [Achromobacter xylosoxidans]|nr:Uncharacterised protein [Achromobacter xylosoxidans]